MTDLEAQNQLVRENRVELAKLALENGVSPLKAAEFGSRVADALKQSWNTPVGDPSTERAGSMLAAVFKDHASGELKAAVLDVSADNKVQNAIGVAPEDAMGIASAEVAAVGVSDPTAIKNYAYTVSPVMTAKP